MKFRALISIYFQGPLFAAIANGGLEKSLTLKLIRSETSVWFLLCGVGNQFEKMSNTQVKVTQT
jgi:hypothetical protein